MVQPFDVYCTSGAGVPSIATAVVYGVRDVWCGLETGGVGMFQIEQIAGWGVDKVCMVL